jgi:hypothetical protein
LSDTLLKEAAALSSECIVRKVEVNLEGLKLNGTRQLVVCGDGVNLWEEAHVLEIEAEEF